MTCQPWGSLAGAKLDFVLLSSFLAVKLYLMRESKFQIIMSTIHKEKLETHLGQKTHLPVLLFAPQNLRVKRNWT